MTLDLTPVTLREARAFVREHHRHHLPPQGGLFAIGLSFGSQVVAVAIVGRPLSRMLDNGWTAEVVRLCTRGHPNACSKLYAACWRAARAMGYRRLVTYILDSEPGVSLTAAGWRCVGQTKSEGWDRPGRPRVDLHPTQAKLRWEMAVDGT